MLEELQTAKELAVRAGDILMEHYASPPSVDWKGVADPVTSADRAASRFLVDELMRRYPQDGILCEEEKDDRSRLSKARVWIVDPMDGTKEFIARRGEFAVMIGLAIDGQPRLGVVYRPADRKIYYASAGLGAFVEQGESVRKLAVSREDDPSRIVLAVSRSHPTRAGELIREQLGIDRTVRSGSAGLKIGMVCEGDAHLYLHVDPHTSQWDTCAPEAILREAGGRVTDIFNAPLRYNVSELKNLRGVIASNGVIHDRVAETAKAVLQQLGSSLQEGG